MESYVIVLTTCRSNEEAQSIIDRVLKARLIACATIIAPVYSHFRWQGEISSEDEVMVVMKTRKKLLNELTEWIQVHHSYEVPEIIALPIIGGSKEYLEWVREETTSDWGE